MEALPLDEADGSRHSTVHRGAARVWVDASHSRHSARSEHGVFGRGGSAPASPAKKASAVELGVRQPGWPS